jgi:TPR repeat protein
MRHVLFVVFLVVACETVAAADSYEDALAAFLRKDYTVAARLFLPVAEQGSAKAQYNLGLMYDKGQGVSQDYQEALKWYRKAADQGQVQAQYNLGMLYNDGQGVPQDYQESLKWYRRAAEQGHARAQGNLGLLYAKGRGIPQDFTRAYMWLNVASTALSGDEGKAAMKNRYHVVSQMTAAQVEKAQEMARRCQQSQFEECD